MRLWSLHPKYLDSKGLVALWREALLAKAVLLGRTRGYRQHPQLERFRSQTSPVSAINAYLKAVYAEAAARHYSFDRSKVGKVHRQVVIPVTSGQIEYEWHHLMAKLAARDPAWRDKWQGEAFPECHPLFAARSGDIEPWERLR